MSLDICLALATKSSMSHLSDEQDNSYCGNIINEEPLDLHDKLPERLEIYLDVKIIIQI